MIIIWDVEELKVKEINWIDVVVKELIILGVDIMFIDDGLIIYGLIFLYGGRVISYGDYCIGMML